MQSLHVMSCRSFYAELAVDRSVYIYTPRANAFVTERKDEGIHKRTNLKIVVAALKAPTVWYSFTLGSKYFLSFKTMYETELHIQLHIK